MSDQDLLATFDPYAPDPHSRYEAMALARAAGGVVPTPAGTYFATARGVFQALKQVDDFVGSFFDLSTFHDDDIPLPAIPEPRHGRIRRVVNATFTSNRVVNANGFIRSVAEALVDDALAACERDGAVDLVHHVVDPLPSTVIAHLLGVPTELQRQFQVWSDELVEWQMQDGNRPLAAIHPEFAAYVQQVVDDHRAADPRPDDIITRFIETPDLDGQLLSDRMVVTQVMLLIIAGNETTRNLIGNCLYRLAAAPELWERLAADRTLVPVLIEESLRLDSPVQILGRVVVNDTEIDGCPLHRGDRVVFGIASANRDEAAYDAPGEFRLDRARPRDHLAFGAGPHICPGANLARIEAMITIETLLDRLASMRLVDGFQVQPTTVFWSCGHRRLDAVLTARTARQ
jgi:cytochrome P450